MGIKVMHLADIHLGMENYGRIDAKTGLNTRLRDFLASFDEAVSFAQREQIDLVVFSGDAFKTRDPNPTLQREFAARIKRLSTSGIPVVMVVGNHDVPNSDGKAHSLEIYRTLGVERVYVARKPETFYIETKQGPVQVACLPYLSRSSLLSKDDFKGLSLEELDKKLVEILHMFVSKLARDLDPKVPSILAAHISVANAVLSSEKSIMVGKDLVLPLSSVALPEFDYVALGHIHRHQNLNEYPPVVYSGSLDRIDFGEEREKKGFCLVDLAKGSTTFSFKPIDGRKFQTLELSPREEDPTLEVINSLGMHDLSQCVVRLNLKLSASQAAVLRLDEINRYLSREAYFLAGIKKEVRDTPQGVRSPGLTEQVSPLEALKTYLDLQEGIEDRAVLIKLAEDLVQELKEEDAS